jgi:hypothetical protein
MSDNDPRLVRFVRATFDVGIDVCEAVVEVETQDLRRFVGAAQGGIGEKDQVRAIARATADALSDAFEAYNAKVRVLSTRVVKGIPHNVVMVTLAASKGTHTRTLFGICDRDSHDTAKAAALAVLNATNRFLSRL